MKIEAGKFYRTRDGLKVGPMWHSSGFWMSSGQDDPYCAVWLSDGCAGNTKAGKIGPLIAEWVDLAPASNSTPRVGDKVRLGGEFEVVSVNANGDVWVGPIGKRAWLGSEFIAEVIPASKTADAAEAPKPTYCVGDEVHVRCKVNDFCGLIDIDAAGDVCGHHKQAWKEAVIKHIPAPCPIAVGDRVTWGSKNADFELLWVNESHMLTMVYGAPRLQLRPFDLTRVD